MPALSPPNIESELSYAYLHAIAARAGMACVEGNRHEDNSGIDARLMAWGPFTGGGYLTEVSLNVQLKATVNPPTDDGHSLSYFLRGVERYNSLRLETRSIPLILVVLFLPPNPVDWLTHTEEQLALRRSAYWTSLCGAPETTNATGETVYIPKANLFNAEGLTALMTRLSHPGEPLIYAG